MLMPTSSEFLTLCRTQIALLTQGLGASLSVVYLTQELVDGAETRLVPIVAYPESPLNWQSKELPQILPAVINSPDQAAQILKDVTPASNSLRAPLEPTDSGRMASAALERFESAQQRAIASQRQMVLPLIHEDVVMGLLVTERNDRAWNEWEQTQIHHIADTLALACVMDQRYQWLDRDRRQQRLIQEQQHDILDNLLHQFRNSLTALQTFSKLILKRLLPGDANRDIATSIAREAARLKELAQQLEATATDIGEDNSPLSLPPASIDWHSDSQETEAVSQSDRTVLLLPGAGVLAGAPLTLEPCSIVEIVTPLLESAKTIAQTRNLTLHTDLPDHLPPALANVQALREVLNNLIENALKYTQAGGHILVQSGVLSTQTEASWVEIAISDTGPGISQADLPHIFERRFRGAQAEGEIPGSGLGLAIARALVEQMHGKIQVFSPAWQNELTQLRQKDETLGQGTTFAVQLPSVIGR